MAMRGSILDGMSEHYQEVFVKPGILRSYHNEFYELTLANKAHVIMLHDRGIIAPVHARSILSALDDIYANLREEDLSFEVEDFFFNVENALIARVGSDVGGRLHTGRSRNDLGAALYRMSTRKMLWALMGGALQLRGAVLGFAEAHRDTVMTGYTHLQPAQPTTLGHYLTGFADALGRDIDRLISAYKNTNRSTLGAGAFAGTGFDIDREQVAELLGFDSVLTNTYDCVASRDYLLQVESACAILMSNLSRLGQDIYVWCTDEFGFWRLGGEIAGQSSIMPQKRNPGIIEHIKAKSGNPAGALMNSLMALKGMPFSHARDFIEAFALFEGSCMETLRAMDLMEEVFRYTTIDEAGALLRARCNFSTVTELADYLVREHGISFRDAHHIVGGMVADARKAGADVSGLTPQALATWSEQILGTPLAIDDATLDSLLLPYPNAQSKRHPGGPNRDRVNEMLAAGRADCTHQQAFLDEAVAKVDLAYARNGAEANRILAAAGSHA